MKSNRQGFPGRTAQSPLQDCAKCSEVGGGGWGQCWLRTERLKGRSGGKAEKTGRGQVLEGPECPCISAEGGIYVSFLHQGQRGLGEEGVSGMSPAPLCVWLGQEGQCK